MTNDEAKFVLTAYRPGGQDGDDPTFAAAIRQARSDPALQAWWARSQRFDDAIAARLREVAPPPGLREAILTGAQLSQPRPRSRPAYAWFALAAAIALLLGVAGIGYRPSRSASDGLSGFARFALNDAHQAGHIGDPDQPLNGWLTTSQEPLDRAALPVTAAELQERGCRSLDFAGRKVFEVCFRRGGVQYHLYLMPRSEAPAMGAAEQVEYSDNAGAAAAWSDARFVYALATQAGSAMLRRAL